MIDLKREILYSFNGKGDLSIKELDVTLFVSLKLEVDNFSAFDLSFAGILTFDTLNIFSNLNKILLCSFVGELDDSRKIKFDAYISEYKLDLKIDKEVKIGFKGIPKDDIYIWNSKYPIINSILKTSLNIKIGLMNFVFFGNNEVKEGRKRRLDYFSTTICEKKIFFKQVPNYKEIIKSLKVHKKSVLTSELLLEDTKYFENIEMIENILQLLNYIQRTYISLLFTEFFDENSLKLLILHNHKRIDFSEIPLKDNYQDDKALSQFIEECYNQYSQYSGFEFQLIFELIINTYHVEIYELKFALVVFALEIICSRFVEINKISLSRDSNRIREYSNIIKKFLRKQECTASENDTEELITKFIQPSFIMIIQKTLDSLKISLNPDLLVRIKRNRDKIVHEAKFFDYRNPYNDFMLVYTILDLIILKLLHSNYYSKFINMDIPQEVLNLEFD